MSSQTKYIPVTAVATLLRTIFKESFSGVKFGVRSEKYAGGSSIHVTWTDGPSAAQVKKITDKLEGSYFDGMSDYKGSRYHTLDGEPVHFMSDYIFEHRVASDELVEKAINALVEKWHLTETVTVADFRAGKLYDKFVVCNSTDRHWSVEAHLRQEIENIKMEQKPSPTLDRIKFAGDDGYGENTVGKLAEPR